MYITIFICVWHIQWMRVGCFHSFLSSSFFTTFRQLMAIWQINGQRPQIDKNENESIDSFFTTTVQVRRLHAHLPKNSSHCKKKLLLPITIFRLINWTHNNITLPEFHETMCAIISCVIKNGVNNLFLERSTFSGVNIDIHKRVFFYGSIFMG